MLKKIATVFVLSLIVAACSTFAPVPTSTPTQTATLVPTSTFAPTSTNTPAPTFTRRPPTETPDVIAALLPLGLPEKEWNGIPVMPNAINGDGDSKSYTFTIKASRKDIEKFYEKELAKQGFNLFAVGEGNEKNTVLMFFMKDTETISVSIFPKDDLMIVMIVK